MTKVIQYTCLTLGMLIIGSIFLSVCIYPDGWLQNDTQLILSILVGIQVTMVGFLFESIRLDKSNYYKRYTRTSRIIHCAVGVVVCAIAICFVLSNTQLM